MTRGNHQPLQRTRLTDSSSSTGVLLPRDLVHLPSWSDSVHQFTVMLNLVSLNRHVLDTETGCWKHVPSALSTSHLTPDYSHHCLSQTAMSQINGPTTCDYCHQRPKFLYAYSFPPLVWRLTEEMRNVLLGIFRPYDYCSKTCGSLATAIRTQGARNPAICKVEFTLACSLETNVSNAVFSNAIKDPFTRITTSAGGSVPMPGRPPKDRSTCWGISVGCCGHRLGIRTNKQHECKEAVNLGRRKQQVSAQTLIRSLSSRDLMSVGGAVQGFVNGVRSLISPPNQPQQQQVLIYPVQLQQPPNSIVNPISNAGSITTNPPTAVTLPATSNRGNNNQPGPFNGARTISSLPIQSASRGAPAPQILTTTNVYTTQTTRPSATGMSLVSRSAQSLSYASEPDDANPELTGQNVDSERDLSEDGGGQYGREESVGGEADVQSIGSALPPRSVDACMLEGCSNPTFVDSITDLESEYCSWKHQKYVPSRAGRIG